MGIIAAQGPMENTVENFWRAVIDNNVTNIIMLTKLKEQRQVGNILFQAQYESFASYS